jgi:D-alanine-D-alanine ligase
MDKAKAKEVFDHHHIPQARYEVFHERETEPAGVGGLADRLADALPFPIFVKPANMGSSIGVSKARDLGELRSAIELALRYDEWGVAEETIRGREIECAVLGNLEPRASVPGEIVPGSDFYSYEDKYFDGTAQLLIPAPLDEAIATELQTSALAAYRALRCEGMARVDFFYEEPGRGVLLNEINTIPGFTPISMYAQMWEASGVGYAELIDELVRLALDRHARRRSRRGVT